MAKSTRGRRRSSSRHCIKPAPYPIHTCHLSNRKRSSVITSTKDLEDITCSVCMEYPHNAVLLLCSSHDKGCRPYMCGTSSRYSNCLDQYTKVKSQPFDQTHKGNELACPLCRGQVKGWTVVESAREYLNSKKRSCMHDECQFIGVYKELKKHVRLVHPWSNPRGVDPDQEQKWIRLEREREHDDVISTVTSSMPGSMVFGDYVIENENNMGIDPNLVNVLLLFHAFGPRGSLRTHDHDHDDGGHDDDLDDDDDGDMSLVNRLRRQGRVILGRSGRRRRNRVLNRSQT